MKLKYIDIQQVMFLTSLGRTSIYKLMGTGSFPKGTLFGVRRVRWLRSEIDAWILEQIENRNTLSP